MHKDSVGTEWTPEREKEYGELIQEQMQTGCKSLVLLAIILFPAFSFLDFYTQGHRLKELLIIRLSTTVFYLGLYPVLGRPFLRKWLYPFSLFILTIASLSITLMCLFLKGYESPYYAGVNLVMLAGVLVLPLGAGRMAWAVFLILATYILGILIQSGLKIENPQALVNNLYFLVATGIIGITAAFLKEKMRRESFDRYTEIVRTQTDLRRSKELLQEELHSEQGNVEVLVKEITQKKTELERAINLRNEFISLASHELNTPLTSLSLQTEIARKKMASNKYNNTEIIEKLLNTYSAQVKRLIRVVDDMLDISRIERGKLNIERSQIDLEKVVAGVIDRVSDKFESGQTPLKLISSGPVVGIWDQFRIEQIVLNLLMNALKYGAGRPVEVSLEKSEESAVLKVRDQGIGIPSTNHEIIFERFERAVKSTEYTGLGLGLYISKQIAEAHGGSISVESELAKGSTFIVLLPLNL